VLALLVTVAVAGASCATTPHAAKVVIPPVLGQPKGTPVVVGQPAPAGTGELSDVSCADAEHCWVVGVAGPNAGNAATTPTTAPTPTSTPTTVPLNTAVTVIAATVNGGLTWSAQPLAANPAPALTGVSCPGIEVCMAVGSSGTDPGTGVVLTTHDGGRTWAEAAPPAGAIAVISVQCASAVACTVVASDGTVIWSATTVDFGHTWVRQGLLPTGTGGALMLSCTSTGTCLVAGYTPTTPGHGQGAIALSTDGGMTWTAATVPSGTGLLQSATCLNPTRCLAAGTTSNTVSDVVPAKGLLLVSADGGHTWSDATSSPPVGDVYGVGCPSATACAMVGTDWQGTPPVGTGAVAESKNAGDTFTAKSTSYTPLTLTALDCPTPELCIAAGGDTVARITLPAPPVPKVKKTHHT
jgi:photosystem II stability/assembly factor-like uncharacterized protein